MLKLAYHIQNVLQSHVNFTADILNVKADTETTTKVVGFFKIMLCLQYLVPKQKRTSTHLDTVSCYHTLCFFCKPQLCVSLWSKTWTN